MTVFRLVVLFCVCLSLSFLTVSSYQQWKFLALPLAQQNAISDKENKFFRDRLSEKLVIEATELRRELEFNLWADEQQALAQRLIKNIKSRIELRPFFGRNWLELVNVQQQYGMHQAEFSWNLINAIRQNGWQKKAFASLAHHCIHQKKTLNVTALKECKTLLSQPFAAKAIGNVKHKLGIGKQQFEKILQDARATQ